MINNKLKIVVINIVAVIIIYFVCKYFILCCMCKPTEKNFWVSIGDFLCPNYEKFYQRFPKDTPPPSLIEIKNDKKPIVIFGCSFADGVFLKDEDKFSYRLYEATERNVYNKAMVGQGLQYMLYQLENEKFYQEFPEPEYVIYVYINDQLRRLYKECAPMMKSPFYKIGKNGKLKKINNPFYYSFPMLCIRYMEQVPENDETYSFLRQHFIYAKELADKHWKNAKWILILYEETPVKYFEELKKYGYTVVVLKDLVPDDFYTNLKYRISETDPHPSKEAWLTITPNFVAKYLQ